MDMVKVWLAVLAPLLKRHPDHSAFITSVTHFQLIDSYHSHTKTMLKYLHDALCGISNNLHLCLVCRKSHSISKIPKIHSHLHYIQFTREMGTANNSYTEISETTHKILIKDSYRASNKVNCILQMFWWGTHIIDIKSSVRILLHIVISDPISPKSAIRRKLLVRDSLASDKLSPALIPHINRVMSKCNRIVTITFPEGISILERIATLTSYCSTCQTDTCMSPHPQTSGFHASWISPQELYRGNGVTVTI